MKVLQLINMHILHEMKFMYLYLLSRSILVAKEIGVQHIMCCGDSDLVAQ
jgi:hypothetical protein